MLRHLLSCAILLAISSAHLFADSVRETTQTTLRNPLMWSDVPDPDIIRVGDYYYLVSTTMHLMPGGPVMRSADLVHWETVSYLFDTLNDTEKYSLDHPDSIGTAYGRGQWATSLRYHKGTFWALFSPNDAPFRSYLMKTDDPANGWTLHARLPHFHDCSLFFDDDDRAYVFSGGGNVQLVELNDDLTDVKAGGVNIALNTRDAQPEGLLEGSRVIKHNGYYYLLMIAWPTDGRQQMAYRSKTITGPYEGKTILKSEFGGFPYVGQGTVVDGKDGEWYGVIFQDRGGVGRVLTLSPCTWFQGWPMIGDSLGHIPTYTPTTTATTDSYISIVRSDDFGSASTLHRPVDTTQVYVPLWQWNHNPKNEAWSLDEREGFLRLRTTITVPTIYHAHNTLTQRMEGPRCSGTIRLDIRHMKDGDRAGFAAFNGHSALLTVEQTGRKRQLVMTEEVVTLGNNNTIANVERQEVARVPLKSKHILLRINADFRPEAGDIATFNYSTDDGETWHAIGTPYKMRFDYTRLFMGTKFAIFNYATRKTGGYVDIDYFEYSHEQE